MSDSEFAKVAEESADVRSTRTLTGRVFQAVNGERSVASVDTAVDRDDFNSKT